eukprot:763203-Hanusia_phi.AAC.2
MQRSSNVISMQSILKQWAYSAKIVLESKKKYKLRRSFQRLKKAQILRNLYSKIKASWDAVNDVHILRRYLTRWQIFFDCVLAAYHQLRKTAVGKGRLEISAVFVEWKHHSILQFVLTSSSLELSPSWKQKQKFGSTLLEFLDEDKISSLATVSSQDDAHLPVEGKIQSSKVRASEQADPISKNEASLSGLVRIDSKETSSASPHKKVSAKLHAFVAALFPSLCERESMQNDLWSMVSGQFASLLSPLLPSLPSPLLLLCSIHQLDLQECKQPLRGIETKVDVAVARRLRQLAGMELEEGGSLLDLMETRASSIAPGDMSEAPLEELTDLKLQETREESKTPRASRTSPKTRKIRSLRIAIPSPEESIHREVNDALIAAHEELGKVSVLREELMKLRDQQQVCLLLLSPPLLSPLPISASCFLLVYLSAGHVALSLFPCSIESRLPAGSGPSSFASSRLEKCVDVQAVSLQPQQSYLQPTGQEEEAEDDCERLLKALQAS